MKKRNRWSFLMTLVCMIAMMMFFSVSASAASKPKCASKVTMRFSTSSMGSQICNRNIYLSGLTSNAKILSVKSSNSKVLGSAEANGVVSVGVRTKSLKPYQMYTLKNGEKANFTIKVRQKKKTYTLKTTVKFVTEKNPVKTIKLDGKSYSSFQKTTGGGWKFSTGTKLPSQITMNVTLNPGFKLVSIFAEYYAPGWMMSDSIPVKNGQRINTKYDGGSLCGIFVHYYQQSDLQGMASYGKLITTSGITSTSVQIDFKK